ncbi:MAG: hypothetical protein WCX83_02965 [Candidatus Cloacimonas sp.]|nr:hypothetical protein [Candidatus Cloacimonadota bacterium]
MKRSLFVCLMLIGIIGSMFAFPFGNYGNIRVPDAYVIPHLMGEITLDNYIYPENNRSDDDFAYNWAGSINVGLLGHGEVGLVGTGDKVYLGNLKLRLVGETNALPDIAIGIDNLFSKVGERKIGRKDMIDAGNYRRNSVYFAVSKTIFMSGLPAIGDLPLRATIGAGSHRFNGTVKLSRQFGGLFGALQVEPVDNFAIITEVDGHNLNAGFGYTYANFSTRLYLYKIEEWNRRDPKFGLSFSYLIDQFATEGKRSYKPTRSAGTGYNQGYDYYNDGSFDELQRIRYQRQRAEREIEEIKRLLEE